MKTIIGLITIYSGFKVILTSNGINSVLNLVLVMVTLSILLIVSGKEYLG
jgi:NADH:ubiquinone oxidoreductase subunit 6 (subunit J)